MPAPADAERDRQKRAAAARAVDSVMPDMVLGLGSGSTAEFVLEALAARVAQGLRVVGIATSQRTEALARRLGVSLTSFAEHRRLDLTIDGADEVERTTLNLVKGLGGALLREKIVAAASARMIVVVDESKLVDRLGVHVPVPVEIVPFGWQTVLERLSGLRARPVLRRVGEAPFVTDGGNYIADCAFPAIPDAAALERQLAAIIGVVESGLFIGRADTVIIGRPSGVEIQEKDMTLGPLRP
jgi:ribose 5-phosphate isomerase A